MRVFALLTLVAAGFHGARCKQYLHYVQQPASLNGLLLLSGDVVTLQSVSTQEYCFANDIGNGTFDIRCSASARSAHTTPSPFPSSSASISSSSSSDTKKMRFDSPFSESLNDEPGRMDERPESEVPLEQQFFIVLTHGAAKQMMFSLPKSGQRLFADFYGAHKNGESDKTIADNKSLNLPSNWQLESYPFPPEATVDPSGVRFDEKPVDMSSWITNTPSFPALHRTQEAFAPKVPTGEGMLALPSEVQSFLQGSVPQQMIDVTEGDGIPGVFQQAVQGKSPQQTTAHAMIHPTAIDDAATVGTNSIASSFYAQLTGLFPSLAQGGNGALVTIRPGPAYCFSYVASNFNYSLSTDIALFTEADTGQSLKHCTVTMHTVLEHPEYLFVLTKLKTGNRVQLAAGVKERIDGIQWVQTNALLLSNEQFLGQQQVINKHAKVQQEATFSVKKGATEGQVLTWQNNMLQSATFLLENAPIVSSSLPSDVIHKVHCTNATDLGYSKWVQDEPLSAYEKGVKYNFSSLHLPCLPHQNLSLSIQATESSVIVNELIGGGHTKSTEVSFQGTFKLIAPPKGRVRGRAAMHIGRSRMNFRSDLIREVPLRDGTVAEYAYVLPGTYESSNVVMISYDIDEF